MPVERRDDAVVEEVGERDRIAAVEADVGVVEVFECGVERDPVEGGGGTAILDRRAHVAVEPLAFALRKRVERRRGENRAPRRDRRLRFRHDRRRGKRCELERTLPYAGEFGVELVDRVARFPGGCENARRVEVACDALERGMRCSVESERGGRRRQDVGRAGVRNAVRARHRAQGVREFAPAAAGAGVDHVEHVRALAGNRQQRARIVGVDRRELRAQRSPRVGVAFRCREAQKRAQPRDADEVELGRRQRSQIDRLEREFAQRRESPPDERPVVDEQQRIDCERLLVGRERALAQHAAHRGARIHGVDERQQRAVLADQSAERVVIVAIDRREDAGRKRRAAPDVRRDREFLARRGDAPHHRAPFAVAEHAHGTPARQKREPARDELRIAAVREPPLVDEDHPSLFAPARTKPTASSTSEGRSTFTATSGCVHTIAPAGARRIAPARRSAASTVSEPSANRGQDVPAEERGQP